MATARARARMQAWRVHAYGAELRLESARVPPLRAPDDVLVAVHSASLNPLDVAMIGGYGARLLNTLRVLEGGGRGEVEFPLVPGRDFAGEVVAAGPAARLRPGTRVWGVVPPHRPGALAQYVLVKDRWTGAAPHALDMRCAGSALYAALSACAALRAAGVWPPRGGTPEAGRVLLLGLGGVGQAALQLLVHVGATVVVGCSQELGTLATSLGATLVLDRNSPDYDRLLEESGPYTAIVDTAGLGAAAAGERRWRFERYVTLSSPLLRDTDARGLAPGALTAATALLRHELAARAAAPASSRSAACAPRVRWAFFSPRADDIELLRRLADNKELDVHVERAYTWEAVVDAFARASLGHARGKLVVDVAPR